MKSPSLSTGSSLSPFLAAALSGCYFSCCLLLSHWRVHGLFKDGRLSSWLQFLRPSRMRAAAKCKAGRQSWLQFLRLSRLTGTAKHEAGLLCALERLFFGSGTELLHAGVLLALLPPHPAFNVPFWLFILHSLDVFAVKPILHTYIEGSGYA